MHKNFQKGIFNAKQKEIWEQQREREKKMRQIEIKVKKIKDGYLNKL